MEASGPNNARKLQSHRFGVILAAEAATRPRLAISNRGRGSALNAELTRYRNDFGGSLLGTMGVATSDTSKGVDQSTVFITDALAQRRPKRRDRRREKRDILKLAHCLADPSAELLPQFVDLAMQMTRAVSGGLSVYDADSDPDVFRWKHLRGSLARFEGATTPRDNSPCGVTLDRNLPVLVAYPDVVDLQNSLLGSADHNVQMSSDGKVALIPVGAVRDLAFRHPNVGMAMWFETLVEGSIFREWILNIGRRNAPARIAHLRPSLACQPNPSCFNVAREQQRDVTARQ